jgi:hypothetical protein
MDVAPFELRKCQQVYIKNNGTATHDFLQGRLERFNIRFAFAQLLANRKSQILMRTASPKLDISHLTPNERADLRCRTALELKDRGEYEAARDAMCSRSGKGSGVGPTRRDWIRMLSLACFCALVFLQAGLVVQVGSRKQTTMHET